MERWGDQVLSTVRLSLHFARLICIISLLSNTCFVISVEHLLEHFDVRLADNFDVRVPAQLFHE